MSGSIIEKDILIADDDSDDVHIFQLAMAEMPFSHKLRSAEDARALFVLLKDKLPYILFLDINMPCKDGMACIVEIRSFREYDQLPIIVYSGHSSAKIVDHAFRNGANMYLAKTVTFHDLVAQLNRIFAIDWTNQPYYPPRFEFFMG